MVHSDNFEDPATGVHTQEAESAWAVLTTAWNFEGRPPSVFGRKDVEAVEGIKRDHDKFLAGLSITIH